MLYVIRTVAAVAAAALLGYAVGWLDHRADLPMGWLVVSGEARVIDGDTIEIDGVRIRLHGLDAPERYQRCLTAAGEEYRCGARAGTALRSFLSQKGTSPPGQRRGRALARTGNADETRWSTAERTNGRWAPGSGPGGDGFNGGQEARRRKAPTGIEYKLARTTVPSGTEIPATITCLSHDTDRWGRRIARCYTAEADINRRMVQQGHALAYRRYSHEYDIDEAYALRHQRGLWSGRFVPPSQWRRGERLGE